MNVFELHKILKENMSSGTLYGDDEIFLYNKATGDRVEIYAAECDSQTSDFLIIIDSIR